MSAHVVTDHGAGGVDATSGVVLDPRLVRSSHRAPPPPLLEEVA